MKAKNNTALIALGLCVLVACATLKDVGSTVNDIAKSLCLLTAEEQQKHDAAALDGLTVEQWCDIKKNLDPFIDEILKAQKMAAGQAGLSVASQ